MHMRTWCTRMLRFLTVGVLAHASTSRGVALVSSQALWFCSLPHPPLSEHGNLLRVCGRLHHHQHGGSQLGATTPTCCRGRPSRGFHVSSEQDAGVQLHVQVVPGEADGGSKGRGREGSGESGSEERWE